MIYVTFKEITHFCCLTKKFDNSLECCITKFYVFGDKFTVSVAMHRSLHVLGTGTKSSRKSGRTCFSSALMDVGFPSVYGECVLLSLVSKETVLAMAEQNRARMEEHRV